MLCPGCGSAKPDDVAFCSDCGTQMVRPTSPAGSVRGGVSPNFNTPLGGFLGSLVLILSLLAIGAVYELMPSRNNDAVGTPDASSGSAQESVEQTVASQPAVVIAPESHRRQENSACGGVPPGTYWCSDSEANETECMIVNATNGFTIAPDCTLTFKDKPVDVRIVP
jgi:hypothetical protein